MTIGFSPFLNTERDGAFLACLSAQDFVTNIKKPKASVRSSKIYVSDS